MGTGRVDGLLDDDLQLTNSGDHLMLPGIGGSVSFYRTSDLSADGVATTSSRYDWTAVAADDAVVAVAKAGSVEVIDRASDTRVNDIILDPGSAGGSVEGVRLVGDQMFAVTRGSTLRLYQVDRPSVAPPDLTLDAPAEAYVARPLTLSGELRDQGTPIPGATVAIGQEGVEQPLGTPKTDAEGRYTLEVVPQRTGTLSLSANYAGDSTIKPTTTSAQVSVVRRSVSLTLAGPASVWPDEQVNLTGSLFDGNDPYAGASLRVDRRCPGAAWETLATVVTDDAGSFAITDAPGSCNSYEYVVTYDGDTQRLATTAARTVQVTWRQPAVDLVAPSEAHVEETINLSGTLTTADGPLADVPVIARVSTPSGWRDLGTLTTDAAGRFDVDDRPALAGAHCYQVTYAGDSRTRAASMQRCVSVTRWASGFVLDGPQTADLDEELLLTGRFVSEGDQTVGGIALDVSRTDTYDGTQALPSVVTGADGGFTIRDTPPNGGDVTYKVAYAGTATRADNWQTITVTVPRASRTLELSTDQSTYDYGQTAHVTVSLTTTPTTEAQRTVQVYAHQAEGYRRLIFSGEVPAAGLTLQPVMKSNTEFSAEIGEDGRALAASSSVPVLTRIGLTTTAKYWYDTVRGYKIYHPRRNPSFVVAARPKNGFGGCVHMRLQRRYASGWRTMFRTECLPLSSVGREAYWTLTGRQATNTPYRVRPTSSGYPVNAPGNGAWVYFKFIEQWSDFRDGPRGDLVAGT